MRPDWLRTTDELLLGYFGANAPDYVPLVANRLNIHLDYAERRVEVLVEHGLLEPVTDERIYTVTERGRRVLAAVDATTAAAED